MRNAAATARDWLGCKNQPRVGEPLNARRDIYRSAEIVLAIVAAEAGAVVKTSGDAVMATFATPDRRTNCCRCGD
jgi:class 3 adenylate cyclase